MRKWRRPNRGVLFVDIFNKVKILVYKAKNTGFGHIFGANMINQIIGFASSFILIRVLPKNEYGIYSYAFNIYSFFALASGFGMESACLQVCSEKRLQSEKANAYMKFGILFGSGFNVVLGVIIGLCSFYMPLPLKGANSVLCLFAIMPLLTTMFNCIQIHFRYNLLNIEYSKCSVMNTALILMGSVVGAVLFKTSGLILFRELAMGLSICFAISIYKFPVKKVFRALRITIDEKKDMLKIALISMLNISTGQMLYLIDVFLLGLLISDELIVASYKTATIIPNALLFIPSALVVYIYPYFAQKNEDKKWVKEKFYMVLKYFAPINAVISIGLIVFAPLIIRIIFGGQYLDAVPAFRLLSLSYFFSATFKKVIGNLLVTQRKLKVNFWIGVMESVLNIITNWILIKFVGSIGAAITTLTISIISAIVISVYFIRLLNRGIKEQPI